MNASDWQNCIREHSMMISKLCSPSTEPVQHIRYICKGRSTRQSQFYQTDIGRPGTVMGGRFGIWVPKCLVLDGDGNYITLPGWFKTNVVQDVKQ